MTCTVFPISSGHICLVKAQVLHVWDWQILVTRAYTRSVVKPNDEQDSKPCPLCCHGVLI